MKLSISNIAWAPDEDEKINNILNNFLVEGVEIAPTKLWTNPTEQTLDKILTYKNFWVDRNRQIVAFQSLLFGRPDLTIFEKKQKREETLQYLIRLIKLGGALGAKVFVFGSPKNRLIGEMALNNAMDIAIPFFRSLGEVATNYNAKFCIEPNPEAYGCDFIRDTNEGINLVKAVNHPGFGLHLDAAAMTLNEENIVESLDKAFPYLAHFHISEPYLQQVQKGMVDHEMIANELKQLNYERYISIEMRDGLTNSNLTTVSDSLRFVQDVYCG